MSFFGHKRAETEKRIGHPSQLCGLKSYTLNDGRSAGLRAVDFRTAAGLDFTVLLDRGMDISEARFKGISLCWRSPAGDVAPSFFEQKGMGWLRSWSAGLLTTCGLDNAGDPCVDDGEELGLHGRISAVPAERIALTEKWDGEDILLSVRGLLREGRLFGPCLEMVRTITTCGSSKGLSVRDTITNVGARRAPCMIVYHINIGFPLLDEGTELIAPVAETIPYEDYADPRWEAFSKMEAPDPGCRETDYMHVMKPDSQGWVTVGVYNRALVDGLGLRIRYRHSELPHFNEWKMMGEREYVLGIEPGNCLPYSRYREREAGRLVYLEVGETISAGVEFEVVEGLAEIETLRKETALNGR